MEGKLINLEGTDSSGKATQTDLLVNHMVEDGREVEKYKFPTYGDTPMGQLVSDYLSGKYGTKEEVGPWVGALFYSQDRLQFVDTFHDKLKDGIDLVLDRYKASNIFQSAKLPKMKDRLDHWQWVRDVERALPNEDAIIFLNIQPQISQKYFSQRDVKNELLSTGQKDIHEEDLDYQEEVRKTYLKIAGIENWIVVNCSEGTDFRDKMKIHEEIYNQLRNRKIV